MKKQFFTILLFVFSNALWAQLQLNRSYTALNGNPYFELSNAGTTPLSLDCFSLISYYRSPTENGFYIINLPKQELERNGIVTISSAPANSQTANNIQLNLNDLYRSNYLMKQSVNTNSFSASTVTNDLFFNDLIKNELDDHLVLLFNGNTLVDASFTINAQKNLSQFFRSLPPLSYNNSCGSLVTVRFGSLQSLYSSIFSWPNEENNVGYFNEFQVRQNTASVQVAWQTTKEKNIRGFEIERRNGSEPWTSVAYIASIASQDDNNPTINYLYGDNTLTRGNVQYRLKQIDMQGRTVYSPAQNLNSLGLKDKIVVYPNPSTDGRISIAFENVNSFRDVQVLDINGQLIQQWVSINNSTQQINNLKRGGYIIRVTDRQSGSVTTEKVLVQ